VYVLTIITL